MSDTLEYLPGGVPGDSTNSLLQNTFIEVKLLKLKNSLAATHRAVYSVEVNICK